MSNLLAHSAPVQQPNNPQLQKPRKPLPYPTLDGECHDCGTPLVRYGWETICPRCTYLVPDER